MKHLRIIGALASTALVLTSLPATPAQAAVKKPRYNSPMPKKFKRYNAPGVTNVNRLLYPRRDYTGVYTQYPDAGSLAGAKRFGKLVGRKPNIVKSFANWGDNFDQAWTRSIWAAGELPQLEMEVWPRDYNGHATLKSIAAGRSDAYISTLAASIRAAKSPVVFSFAHEFNGEWYPWGYCASGKRDTNPAIENGCDYLNRPKDFVAAWKRIHKIFVAKKATNAIWMWQPNEVGSRPKVYLKSFFPGNAAIDWVGVVGYYRTKSKRRTFDSIFKPTFTQVGKLTKKPILIPEIAVSPVAKRSQYVRDFLAGVSGYPNVIGFIWFNQDKRPNESDGDFRLEGPPSGIKAYKAGLAKGYFGVKVR
ncbi:MAG: glycosyl hydrolase [Streptosporangiaceae bacterium]